MAVIIKKRKKKSDNNYVDNNLLTTIMEEWTETPLIKEVKALDKRIKKLKSIKNKTPEQIEKQRGLKKEFEALLVRSCPTIPPYAAESFIKIANKRAQAVNFKGYSYKEEMIGYGIVSCVRYAYNFDKKLAGTGKAFAYFSQFVFNAFVAYINKEKKLSNYKFETIRDNVEGIDSLNYNNIVKSNRDSKGNYIDRWDD